MVWWGICKEITHVWYNLHKELLRITKRPEDMPIEVSIQFFLNFIKTENSDKLKTSIMVGWGICKETVHV